jgi:predicted acetyltransferase
MSHGDPTMPTQVPDDPQLLVRHATLADQQPIRRMLELYQHDLSDIWDQDLDVHGEYGYALDRYWQQPVHQAFAFLVQGCYAGFALVDDDVRLRGDDLWMAQFFVLKKYRRRHLGQRAAVQVFDTIRGRWQIGQMAGNHRAHAFWRQVVGSYTQGRFVEHELHDKRWDGWLQCFDNRRVGG